jgi:hypothetical protein
MRVTEIVSESTIINEALTSKLLSLILPFLTVLSAKEIYDILSKNGFNPASMSTDDWLQVFIEFVLMIPGFGSFAKFGGAALSKLIPNSIKERGANILRQKVLKELDAINKGAGTAAEKRVLKRKAVADYRAQAEKKFSLIPKPVAMVIKSLAAGDLFIVYYRKLSELEDQYDRAQNGDVTTYWFGDTPKDQQFAIADTQRKKYLGELTAGLAIVFASQAIGKLVSGFGTIFGTVGAVVGGGLVGGLVKLPFEAVSMIIKSGGAALIPLFLHTEAGKAFLATAIAQLATTGLGTATAEMLELLYKGIDEASRLSGVKGLAAKAGLDATMPRTKIVDPNAATSGTPGGAGGGARPVLDPNIPNDLRVTKDDLNPNIIYIGQVQVTDDQGFRTIGNTYKNMLSQKAKAAGIQDPTATLKLNPNRNYNI